MVTFSGELGGFGSDFGFGPLQSLILWAQITFSEIEIIDVHAIRSYLHIDGVNQRNHEFAGSEVAKLQGENRTNIPVSIEGFSPPQAPLDGISGECVKATVQISDFQWSMYVCPVSV